MNEPKRKRGRPKKEGSRTYEAKTRMTEEEIEKLIDLSQRTGESRSELLREAFNMFYVAKDFALRNDMDNFI